MRQQRLDALVTSLGCRLAAGADRETLSYVDGDCDVVNEATAGLMIAQVVGDKSPSSAALTVCSNHRA